MGICVAVVAELVTHTLETGWKHVYDDIIQYVAITCNSQVPGLIARFPRERLGREDQGLKTLLGGYLFSPYIYTTKVTVS